jgi:hypothetical protein
MSTRAVIETLDADQQEKCWFAAENPDTVFYDPATGNVQVEGDRAAAVAGVVETIMLVRGCSAEKAAAPAERVIASITKRLNIVWAN